MNDGDRHYLECMVDLWLLERQGLVADMPVQEKLDYVIKMQGRDYISREWPGTLVHTMRHLGLDIGDEWEAPEDEKLVRVGTAALIFRDGQLLLGKRKGSHGAGTWSFPGGHVDFGEDPIESVRREIMEETGMEVGDIHPYGPLPYVNTHFHTEGKQYITLYFTCKYTGGEANIMEPDKCEAWQWFPAQSLPRPLFEPIAFGGITEKLQGL